MTIVEHELVREFDDFGPPCPNCGGEMDWEDCEQCDGEGDWYPHELSPIEYPDPDELSPCQICDGAGYWWRCGSCREWCPVHSVPKA